MRVPLLIGVLCLGCAALATAKDVALVANKDTSLKSVALPELVKICKGQTSRWPDGKLVTFITRDPSTPEMQIVLQKVYGMSPNEVNAMIAAANHDRVDRPAIVVVNSDDAVVKKVQSTPGAVGLVDVYSITSGVTVLRVAGKLPLEPGYALHGH
jgi:ABC-type phosphate transport system substrate-binding protein